MSTYHGKHLGTIGDFGCYSFHETKNYSMGEGGAIVINNEKYVDRAQIIREKGTNRSQFLQGLVDKYTWVDVGSSFLPSDLNAAFLYPQLEQAEEINQKRMHSWNLYYALLESLVEAGKVQLPKVPDGCIHNAHLFYIKMKDVAERIKLIRYLKKYQVTAVFHYIPLHSAPAGQKFGRFYGEDRYTTIESNRLLRLPMYFDLSDEDVRYIVGLIKEFYDMR